MRSQSFEVAGEGHGVNLDDPTIDQKKDHGHRRGADRPHDDYGDYVNGVGDQGQS